MPGVEYAESIINAIEECFIMVVVLSGNSNISRHVLKEVERAVSLGKIIIPFRIEDIPLSKSLEYFLSSEHWLDAMSLPIEEHIGKLTYTLVTLLKSIDNSICGDSENNNINTDKKRYDIKFKEVPPTDWTLKKSNNFFSKVKELFQDT